MTASRNKSERIDIRTTPAAKDTLQRAATIANKNVSEFLLDAGMAAAMETLADRRLFVLDDKKWRAFQEALDRPVRPLPRLKKLLAKPSILE
jgi:uncharacterized protein (DUF1778 family)